VGHSALLDAATSSQFKRRLPLVATVGTLVATPSAPTQCRDQRSRCRDQQTLSCHHCPRTCDGYWDARCSVVDELRAESSVDVCWKSGGG